eukprot:3389511-Pleurochrysis_carterae.AAC.1
MALGAGRRARWPAASDLEFKILHFSLPWLLLFFLNDFWLHVLAAGDTFQYILSAQSVAVSTVDNLQGARRS